MTNFGNFNDFIADTEHVFPWPTESPMTACLLWAKAERYGFYILRELKCLAIAGLNWPSIDEGLTAFLLRSMRRYYARGLQNKRKNPLNLPDYRRAVQMAFEYFASY